MNNIIKRTGKCAMCRSKIDVKKCHLVKKDGDDDDKKEVTNINKWGTKTARLVEYLEEILVNPDHRVIVFSQFQNMLSSNNLGQILKAFVHFTKKKHLHFLFSQIHKPGDVLELVRQEEMSFLFSWL